MLNERQKDLAMIIAVATSFIATVLIYKYHEITAIWVLYNIPACLVLATYPKWKTSGAIIALILLSKTFMVYQYIPLEPVRFVVSSLASISVFLMISYIIIKTDRLIAKYKKKRT